MPTTKLFPITLLIILLVSCNPWSGRSFKPSIPGYDDRRKVAMVLNKQLLEISGQVNLSDEKFAAINDEDGEIIFFSTNNSSTISSTKFAKKGDYEDIKKVDSNYYVMESNGDIHEITPAAQKSTQYKFELEKKVEFESLAYYEDLHKLVLITKDHGLDKNALYAYSFDLRTKSFDPEPFFTINMSLVLRKLKDYAAQFKPSGAAIHPITKKLYLVASIGKCIVICSKDGVPEAAYDLNPDQFQQPEGISFASNGDMFISNEGLNGKATLIKYPYNPATAAKNITTP